MPSRPIFALLIIAMTYPNSPIRNLPQLLAILVISLALATGISRAGELAGINVIPHQIDKELKYRREHDPIVASRIQLFMHGPTAFKSINSKTAAELLEQNEISWHDLSNVPNTPTGALSVWNINGKSAEFELGKTITLEAADTPAITIPLTQPTAWISAITFLRKDDSNSNAPNRVILYVQNASNSPLQISQVKLWLPKAQTEYQVLWPQPAIPVDQNIPAQDKGFIDFDTPELPLTYTALEVTTSQGTLWSYLRIKREQFDISGGWVFDSKGKWQEATETDAATGKTINRFLDLLTSMHINTAHYENAGGYSDNPQLLERNPLKRFAKLWPTHSWEQPDQISKIHAVEFLGEPQYGGGRPVPPQEVFDAFLPYRTTKLPTSVTHSEERIWRYYAGLSDYPHFDAYRVVAPAADNWRLYERWNGQTITWGAPLETVGNLCRSQRDLNRPMPCAAWSQGPHDGWGGGFSFTKRRPRRSPNPDELRAQALHALASRITSLYWFNLSKSSLEKFPDTWEPMRRLGREIRMLEDFYLEGDAYRFEKTSKETGEPNWELSSILSPQGMLLFALDTDYKIDPDKQEFVFGPPRSTTFEFAIPQSLAKNANLKRVDADGLHTVEWKMLDGKVQIKDQATSDRIYILTANGDVFGRVEAKRQKALQHEETYQNTSLSPN